MYKKFLRLVTVIFLSCAALLAQNNPPSGAAPAPRAGRQEPCWKQAGVSQSAFEQRQQIDRDAHSQIASVCENSSMSPEQKRQQVQDIHQQAQQKVNAIITAEQQSAIHSCQQQRHGNAAANEGHHPGAGPCGNFGGRQGAANGNASGSAQTPEN